MQKGRRDMNLSLNPSAAEGYHSQTQIARVLTESWVRDNLFCPRCGNRHIEKFPNNQPVADFFCPNCGEQYELKSRKGNLTSKITDGAYHTMIERITSNENPDFLFLGYDLSAMQVVDLMVIPKYFFVPEIIEKRKPLGPNARRAGWVGCNILLEQIPVQGRIPIVMNRVETPLQAVLSQVQRSSSLKKGDMASRSWLMDVLSCVNALPGEYFTLANMYAFEQTLAKKHQNNHTIKAKIRQQLQFLRDKGYIEFLGNGQYKKLG